MDNNQKKETFFLFGSIAVREYEDKTWKSFIKSAIAKHCDHGVFCYTEGYNTPNDLLVEYDGWDGFVEITKEQYIYLSDRLRSKW